MVRPGIVAVAYTEKLKYDDRVDLSSRILMTPSLILIWGFSDPIHPQLVLEAPEDIYTFKFNPTDPNIVAAGCINGQVIGYVFSFKILTTEARMLFNLLSFKGLHLYIGFP